MSWHAMIRHRGALAAFLALPIALLPPVSRACPPARTLLPVTRDKEEIPAGLVGLHTERTETHRGPQYRVETYACTGFVVGTPRGQEVVTARHCLKPRSDLLIYDAQQSTAASRAVVSRRGADMALVEPAGRTDFPEAELGDSHALRRGELLCAWRVRAQGTALYWDRSCGRYLGRRTVDIGQGAHPVLLMEGRAVREATRTMGWGGAADAPGALYPLGTSGFHPASEWLAFRGWCSSRCSGRATSCARRGVRGDARRGRFVWPLWTARANCSTVRSLLAYPDVKGLSTAKRRALGIAQVFEAGLTKGADGYSGVFSPSAPV